MNKIFKIGIKIKGNLKNVVITADAETISSVASIINNRELNPKVVDYRYDGPTVIILTPYKGHEDSGNLVTGIAYLATLFAQADNLNDVLEIVEEKASWLTAPLLEGILLHNQTVSELKKIWLGVRMVTELRRIAHDLQYEGLYSGEVSKWLYEGNEAFRRLKFNVIPTAVGLNTNETQLDIIQRTLDIITAKNKAKNKYRDELLKEIEEFSTLLEEEANSLSFAAITKQYIAIENALYAERARLAKEVQDFVDQYHKAHEAIKEIRRWTPPEPPTPIIKK